MKLSEQRKGREHLVFIQERALTLLRSKYNWKHGNWFTCIREALQEHREYLIRCVKEREKIKKERKKEVCEICEVCETPLTSHDVSCYLSLCHDCWKKKYVDAACAISPKKQRPVAKPRPVRGLCL